jgi:hypothetical protein
MQPSTHPINRPKSGAHDSARTRARHVRQRVHDDSSLPLSSSAPTHLLLAGWAGMCVALRHSSLLLPSIRLVPHQPTLPPWPPLSNPQNACRWLSFLIITICPFTMITMRTSPRTCSWLLRSTSDRVPTPAPSRLRTTTCPTSLLVPHRPGRRTAPQTLNGGSPLLRTSLSWIRVAPHVVTARQAHWQLRCAQ